jgi:hypothetical protein
VYSERVYPFPSGAGANIWVSNVDSNNVTKLPASDCPYRKLDLDAKGAVKELWRGNHSVCRSMTVSLVAKKGKVSAFSGVEDRAGVRRQRLY